MYPVFTQQKTPKFDFLIKWPTTLFVSLSGPPLIFVDLVARQPSLSYRRYENPQLQKDSYLCFVI